jgi:hypothetical protein
MNYLSIIDRLRAEPVLVAGTTLALLTLVYEAGVADGFTPAVIVPVLLAWATRHFTVPASEVVLFDEPVLVTEEELDRFLNP